MKTCLVVVGFVIHNNKVLLIHHKKLGIWVPPGGHIEENETPDEALERELKEELNLDVEILNRNDIPNEGNIKKQLALPFYINVHNVGDHDHCGMRYLCRPKNINSIRIDKQELNDYKWFSLKELDNKEIPVDVKSIAKKAFELYKKII